MDESEAVDQQGAATPIFNVYRRGYDPEQVDRYVTDQQRRLDDALHRASESERKLAAAVGQLRELHRRVAVYESEARTAQPPALDTLGERVQRILQEAWEGAYNLRQEAEREVADLRDQVRVEVETQREQVRVEVETQREEVREEVRAQRERAEREVEELRQVASTEAAELVDEATRRALALRDEMERRREAYLERVERDRQRAVSQISFLYDQRQLAISELARLQATVQATIEEMVRSPLGKPAAAIADAAAAHAGDGDGDDAGSAAAEEPRVSDLEPGDSLEGVTGLEAELLEAAVETDSAPVAVSGDVEAGEEAALDDPSAADGGGSPTTGLSSGSLFDQIITDDAEPTDDGFDESAPAPWDHLSHSEPEPRTVKPERLEDEEEGVAGGGLLETTIHAEEIPTGPMDVVEPDLAPPAHLARDRKSEPSRSRLDRAEERRSEPTMPVEPERPGRGRIYDAETDDWI